MKTPLIALLLFSSVCFSAAAEVGLGDTIAEVRQNLGVPRGELHVGGRDLFYYDRGEVESRSGVVTRVSLRSVADQTALEARRAADILRVREENELRRARLTLEGNELKARKLADPSFASSPLVYQVAFWEDFSRRYSEVPVSEQLVLSRARFAEQVVRSEERNEKEKRLADLEARIAEAEARAAEVRRTVVVTGGYYSPYRYRRDDHPLNFGKIEYRLYESPLPYATSPGMPPMLPTYRQEITPVKYGSMVEILNSAPDCLPYRSGNDRSATGGGNRGFRRF
jgi:hypothetical protein